MTETDIHTTVVTGTRAEYGLLKSSMRAIADHAELSLSVVATGMHLSPSRGMTVEAIRQAGFPVDREVHMNLEGDSGKTMAKSLGTGVSGLAEAFDSLAPDVILLLGDRDEALAGALAGAHMNIPVAHIHGGDAMQGAVIDDSIRHAITKFAHIHFPASEKSAERIERLGEEAWRITVAGAPGLDDVLDGRYTTPEDVYEQYDLDRDQPLLLVVQHPVTTQPEQAREQMAATLDAISDFDAQVVLIYPNSDAGGDRMIVEIEQRSFDQPVTTFRNLPREDFLGVMAIADVMVGNSSSGIIEAPSFGLPVVDVGPRQEGRERADNTLSVPHEMEAIRGAINRGVHDEAFRDQAEQCTNPYDYGGAGRRIVDTLAEIDIDGSLLRKRLTY